jgi:hypothetical protein
MARKSDGKTSGERTGAPSQEGSGAGAADLAHRTREQPYAVLGIAAFAGYVLGGGLFSRVTRPLVRLALGALVVPRLQSRASRAAEGFRRHLSSEPAPVNP